MRRSISTCATADIGSSAWQPTSLAALEPAERAVLESYARGVNAGLDSLRVRPFEYLLLRQEPRPWRVQDS
jgi:penicillin amidase